MFKDLFEARILMDADTGSNGGSAEGGNDDGGQDDGSSDGKENTDTKTGGQDEHMIPKSRFDEVNNSYKELKSKVEELTAAQEAAEKEAEEAARKEAEEKGEFETLYNEAKENASTLESQVESANERVEALEGIINGLLETEMESIDEDYHDLIPEGMTPEQKLAWVNNAKKKGIFGKNDSEQPLGTQTNGKSNGTLDSQNLDPLQMMSSGYSK